jgi:catechol 2,3-dioxygenase-like lactoylglutathione lyase family enzyme
MDWKLEVVVIPVTDIDRAKGFYTGALGFRLDADTSPTETMRVVHMTRLGVLGGDRAQGGAPGH